MKISAKVRLGGGEYILSYTVLMYIDIHHNYVSKIDKLMLLIQNLPFLHHLRKMVRYGMFSELKNEARYS